MNQGKGGTGFFPLHPAVPPINLLALVMVPSMVPGFSQREDLPGTGEVEKTEGFFQIVAVMSCSPFLPASEQIWWWEAGPARADLCVRSRTGGSLTCRLRGAATGRAVDGTFSSMTAPVTDKTPPWLSAIRVCDSLCPVRPFSPTPEPVWSKPMRAAIDPNCCGGPDMFPLG